jgi:Ras-related protein Rab-6A
LQLWDTAGQERFRSLIPNYIRNCRAALIIFDLTNEESYDNISKWIDFVKENSGEDVMMVVVGNKLDLIEERKVSYEVAKEKVQELGAKYFEGSAKTGENI